MNTTSDGVLECTFFGNPIPNVRWMSKATSTNVTVSVDKNTSQVTSRLHVKDIDWSDRGLVACIASSILGEVNKTGRINVLGKNVFSRYSSDDGIFYSMNTITYSNFV